MDPHEPEKSKTTQKLYKCSEKGCSASFTKNNKLVYHMRKHSGERPFACKVPDCGKSYTNSSHLSRHIKLAHNNSLSEEVVECYHCQKLFSNKWNLIKHINRLHNFQNLPFACSQCPEKFKKRHFLQEHMYVHTGIPPFSCDKCDYKFSLRKDFHKHRFAHKQYSCSCGKTFTKWSLLMAHRKGTPCESVMCKVCNMKLKSGSSLKQHELTHRNIDEKNLYKCSYENCDKQFVHKKNLTNHVNLIHKGLKSNNKCDFPGCERILSTKQKLREHILKMHSNERKVQREPKVGVERKPRKDKGIPRVDIAFKLAGIINENVINCGSVNNGSLTLCMETCN